jgi:23S rRNA pseudouridine1911/1915/1917 synthase
VPTLELLAAPDVDGARLDVFLARAPQVGSRSRAQRLIEAGRVTVDGRPARKRHRLAPGERVVAALDDEPAASPGPVTVPYRIVYEDDALMVVDKPAGVVVHPAAGHRGPTLAGALTGRAAGGEHPERAGIVHRLDRDTSGLLVVAKSDEAYRALQGMMRRREVTREYVALVEGRPDALSGTIDAPIGRDRRNRTTVSTRTDERREAVTHFEQLEALPRTTLLRLRLETGRTHQIRAHLAAIGHPVCGDPQYGGERCGRRLGLTRQFLHSSKVAFRHPMTGEQTACESKLPVDLRRTLGAARREPVSEGPDGD